MINMDTQEKRYIYVIVVVTFTMMALVLMNRGLRNDVADIKLDKCIFAMQKAIPDPNDDRRVEFLKDCYNN